MFEALKKLWDKAPTIIAKPKVKNSGVSEPVISFVSSVKKDPKRFIISKQPNPYFSSYIEINGYTIKDRVNGKTFNTTVVKHKASYGQEESYMVNSKPEPWLTDEEVLYVVNELEKSFKYKVERVKAKIEKRARERLTKLYKGE